MTSIRNIVGFFTRKEILVLIIISFISGFLLRGSPERSTESDMHVHDTDEVSGEKAEEWWTCSMHPTIRLPKPGKCPICAMDLIPVTSDTQGGETSARELSLSPRAAKLAEVEMVQVERKFVQKEIRMVGKVEYDETRLKYITAWLPGRIDRLYVDYTGIQVRKDDHLVYIYSPDLLTAQEELIQALKAKEELKDSKLSSITETAGLTIDAAREKLSLLGLTKEQIADFEKRGEPVDHVTIYSPVAGIVIHKNAVEGIYVNTGTKIYTIADLSQVWVKLDVYESDLAWIRYGQKVEFHAEAYPGEMFTGKIAFIDPVLNEKTRTIKIRVNVPNPDGKLKPDMFVRSVVYSRVAEGGKVIDQSIANSYICPMHPEIVEKNPGVCDICEMDLVKAEKLGYSNPTTSVKPLVIPASAPLITGKRAVVYVSVPGKNGTYEGREIILGPRAGDYYLVKGGLAEGEMVVVNGNFKIDSAIQILAKPSMMSPEGGIAPAGHNHGDQPVRAVSPVEKEHVHDMTESKTEKEHEHKTGEESKTGDEQTIKYDALNEFMMQLDKVFEAYFHIQFALSHDNLEESGAGAKHMQMVLDKVDMSLLSGESHMVWMKELEIIVKSGKTIENSKDIAASRTAFISLSQSMINALNIFGTTSANSIYRFHCPMADNKKGADWLQNKSETENPFYGSSMLKCGDLVETISTATQK